MDAIDPAQIYVGGAASGVACATCSATSTSGSWRKGWALGIGGDAWANLCNRCGQRWAKAGRPDLRPGEELGTRRPEVKDKERSGWSDGRHHKFARPSYSPTNSDSETSRGNNFFISAHAPEVPPSGASPSSPGQYVSFCLQKVCHVRTQYMLVWVQDARHVSTLAVVGTDARSSGHYTYTKAPDFPGPPLTCTNRARVLNWLGQLGIHNQVQEGTCILPSLSPAALLHLAEGARTVGCAWVDVREEAVHLGGHLSRRFFLVNAYGGQALAATSTNGNSVFRAEPAFGGALFPSRASLVAWLESHLSHGDDVAAGPGCGGSYLHLPSPPCYAYVPQAFLPGPGPHAAAAVGGKVRPRLPTAFHGADLEGLDDLAFPSLSPVTLINTGDDLGMACLQDPALSGCLAPQPAADLPPNTPTLVGHFHTPAQPAQQQQHMHMHLLARPPQPQFEEHKPGSGSLISPHQLMHWAQVLSPPLPGTPPLHAATALPILSELSHCDVDLAALDSTDLSRAVTALRKHPDASVAHMAGRVTSRWRSSALSVLSQAAAR
ncbi:hypothetical protein ACKKBG_A00880 [Auxenochlorella protothecoides x Auxenochlorella symbiontica]